MVRAEVGVMGEDADGEESGGEVMLLDQAKPSQERIPFRMEVNLGTVRETARESRIRASHAMTRVMERKNSP